jgi:hypothetical protein
MASSFLWIALKNTEHTLAIGYTRGKEAFMIAYVALLIALVGVLMYALASNPKLVEIGRIMFFCGLLVVTWFLGAHQVKLFPGP